MCYICYVVYTYIRMYQTFEFIIWDIFKILNEFEFNYIFFIQLANNTYVHCIELFGSSNNKIKNCIEVVIKQITFVPFINRVNDTLVLGRGGANIKWASSITRRVMESDTDECSDVLTHNIEAGIQVSRNVYGQ